MSVHLSEFWWKNSLKCTVHSIETALSNAEGIRRLRLETSRASERLRYLLFCVIDTIVLMDNSDSVDRSSEEFATVVPVAHGTSHADNGPRISGDGAPQSQPRALVNEPSAVVDGVMQSDVCSRGSV